MMANTEQLLDKVRLLNVREIGKTKLDFEDPGLMLGIGNPFV